MSRLDDLRDNCPEPLPNEGQARKLRIERAEKKLNTVYDFLNDCERWRREMLDIDPEPTVVGDLMREHLEKLKTRAEQMKAGLQEELRIMKKTQ